jgi:hypothetical protein
MDMSEDAIDKRAVNKGSSNRLLSKFERTLLAGNILFKDMCRHDTSTGAIRNMADCIAGFELLLNKSWISKFLASEHLSLRSAVGAHPSERLASKKDELSAFLNLVRSVTDGVPDDRVVNFDFTSVYSTSLYVRQAGAKGGSFSLTSSAPFPSLHLSFPFPEISFLLFEFSERPRRHLEARGKPDKNFTALRKDGRKFLLYRTASPALANYPVDASCEYILCVPKLKQLTATPTIDTVIAFFYVLIQRQFLKPYSVGTIFFTLVFHEYDIKF